MCYTIVTEKERGNHNDLCRNVCKHNEKIRQKLRTVGKIQKVLFYVSRPPQSNGKNLQQHNERGVKMVIYLVYWRDELDEIFRNLQDAENYIEEQINPKDHRIESWIVR